MATGSKRSILIQCEPPAYLPCELSAGWGKGGGVLYSEVFKLNNFECVPGLSLYGEFQCTMK